MSSTNAGFSDPGTPDINAGTSSPIVAYESSANSGKKAMNAGLIPEAFQLELYSELNAPSGVFTCMGIDSSPNTALR